MILHQHFNTPAQGGAVRSYYLAKALADHGIETVVITGSNKKKYSVENVEGIEVHSLPVMYENAFGFVARSFSFLNYAWKSFQVGKKIQDVTICYAISVPLTIGLPAIWLKRQKKIPFIFEVGDLWPEAPIQMRFVNNYFLKSALYNLEKYIYREAQSIVALSIPIREAIEKKVSQKKIDVIPNMADCDYYLPEVKNPTLQEKYSAVGKFVVSYVGTMGAANGLDYLIECANSCRKAELPVQFILCGDGAMLGWLKSSAEKLSLNNITFTGFVDRAGVKEVMNVTDAVFVCYKNLPVLETGSPNKYFDGLASGKMIVTNFGGWIKGEIEREGCGIACDPKNPADFVNKIKPFISGGDALQQFQHAARTLAESRYSRKNLSSIFAGIFSS